MDGELSVSSVETACDNLADTFVKEQAEIIVDEDAPDTVGLIPVEGDSDVSVSCRESTRRTTNGIEQPMSSPDKATLKSMDSKPPSAALKIDVEEPHFSKNSPFTPKKEPIVFSPDRSFPTVDPSALRMDSFAINEESPVNSASTTPFAKVRTVSIRSASLGKEGSFRSFECPDKLPSVQSNTLSSAVSSSPVAKTRRHSMNNNSEPPPLFNLDSRMSPSDKFRSFMKSLAPQRSVLCVEEESEENNAGMGGLSTRVSASEGSTKLSSPFHRGNQVPLAAIDNELAARIARVQEEQDRFRRNEKLRNTVMSSQARLSRGEMGSSSNLSPISGKPSMKLKANGEARNFNANSIRAGLSRQEFRHTLEVGSAIVKHSPENGTDQDALVALNVLKRLEPHHQYDDQASSVTKSGPGYMNDADWKITVKDPLRGRSRTPTFTKSQKMSPLSAQLMLARTDSLHGGNSSINLEQYLELTLREQTHQSGHSADCPGTPDVPLNYLQSAHLIDRRFGWDTKDHSVAHLEPPKMKSWTALKAVVHSTGAFHLIAAAAAPVMTDIPTNEYEEEYEARRRLLEPQADAPYIVQEATPVTELVASLLHRPRLRASSADAADRLATPERLCPLFSISKQVPQRLSPTTGIGTGPAERGNSPIGPKLKALSKEEQKNHKIKAHTKEFHDRYNGLIFRDSCNLTWHDTEDMIKGTVRPRKNDLLLSRGDMRWAGKTLNMFRPWSAARETDVMDHFRLQRDNTAKSGSLSVGKAGSTPGSPLGRTPGSPLLPSIADGGPPQSPTDRFFGSHASRMSHGGGSVTGSVSPSSRHKNGGSSSPVSSVRGGSSHASVGHVAGHPRPHTTHAHTRAHAPIHAPQMSRAHAHAHTSPHKHPPRHTSPGGGGCVSGGSSITSAGHSLAVHTAPTSIPSAVTFAAHPSVHGYGAPHIDQSDNASAFTMNSNLGSRSSTHSRRPPLLINIVRPLPVLPH